MHHFFVEPSNIREGKVYITGSDVHHIKQVLRLPLGEMIEVSDGSGKRYQCEIMEYKEFTLSERSTFSEGITLSIVSEWISVGELPARITLFQGLPKSDKMELIIQKAVELGVYEIVPVTTKRSVVKLDEKKAQKKVERWNVIAESAAKQSKRDLIPLVKPVMSYPDALVLAAEMDVVLLPYEQAEEMDVEFLSYEQAAGMDVVNLPYGQATVMEATKEIVSKIERGQSVGVFIGPEGGFEPSEVSRGIEYGAIPISLGKRILRTETAGLALLSILMFHLEN